MRLALRQRRAAQRADALRERLRRERLHLGVVGAGKRRRDALKHHDARVVDVVIGLASSGPHSNGYSLIRKLVSVAGADDKTQLDGKSLFDRLLTPTRIYVKSLLSLAQKINVKGFAHITGGGLTDNIPRVLPDGFEVALHRRNWPRDPVFDWLAATGKISAAEMYRTFNCGIGMVVVVAPADVDATLAHLKAIGRNRLDHRRRRERLARRGHRGMTGMPMPVAVVISGRGSNMEAIARASLQAGSPLQDS